jgi:hypothetical protein
VMSCWLGRQADGRTVRIYLINLSEAKSEMGV